MLWSSWALEFCPRCLRVRLCHVSATFSPFCRYRGLIASLEVQAVETFSAGPGGGRFMPLRFGFDGTGVASDVEPFEGRDGLEWPSWSMGAGANVLPSTRATRPPALLWGSVGGLPAHDSRRLPQDVLFTVSSESARNAEWLAEITVHPPSGRVDAAVNPASSAGRSPCWLGGRASLNGVVRISHEV